MHLLPRVGSDGLYGIDLRYIAGAALVAFLIAIELGYRFGVFAHARHREPARSNLSTLQTAVLSLLALMLAFSFAMAEGRYDTRRHLVLEESNAIGTAFLRTSIIDEPERSELRALFRRYIDVRIAFNDAGAERRRQAAAAAVRLQGQLWDAAVRADARTANKMAGDLFLRSLNDVIDLHEARVSSLEYRVPGAIKLLIFAVGVIAAALVGYGCGLDGARKFGLTSIAAIVFVSVGALVLDLDRPYRGLIQVPQQSMLRLRQSVRSQ